MSELIEQSSERLLKLVRKKKKAGEDVFKAPETDEDSGKIIDLVEMLQRSLKAGPAGTGTGTGTELKELTRAELYERAQEMDIDGRSDMTKAELVAAIRKVG